MGTTDAQPIPEGLFVSPDWLAAHLHSGAVRVVDIRGKVLPPDAPPPRYLAKRADYDEGHIPGAVFVDWTVDIVDPDDPVPAQLAPPSRFEALMGALGIGNDTTVVVYDDYKYVFAGRFAWALRHYGHGRVRLLEGGYDAWRGRGLPVSREVPTVPAAAFTVRVDPKLRVTADDVEAAIQRGACVLDARGPAQYAGEVSAARRKGHIPTARNVPYPTLIDDATGAFKPREELARIFREAGVAADAPPREIIAYCNGGVSATVVWHALRLVGVEHAAIYDGSWNEWGNDDRRPLAAGVEPGAPPRRDDARQ
jgi:thiosulfate/3-mercaptopyruvate sulfurtransferase